MKFEKDDKLLGFPKEMKIGIELETENTRGSTIKRIAEEAGWRYDKDTSLVDSGAEFVSPVLSENDPKVWEKVSKMCDEIKAHPHDERGAYTDATCGGHIHFDSKILTQDPKRMENFLKIWSESEELVYKMCNPEGEAIRASALEPKAITKEDYKEAWKTPKGCKNLRDVWNAIKVIKSNIENEENVLNRSLSNSAFSKYGYASPSGAKLQKEVNEEKPNLAKRIIRGAVGRVDKFFSKYKMSTSRFKGLNLANIGNKHKNTIEFRMSNGTIDINEIKKNAFLYASIINTAVQVTENPELYQEKMDNFMNRDVSQDEKAQAFLELIMDSKEDRDIYMGRYESVKDNPVFSQTKGARNFSKGVFRRDDFKEVAENESTLGVKKIFEKIKEFKNRKLEQTKENEGVDYEQS